MGAYASTDLLDQDPSTLENYDVEYIQPTAVYNDTSKELVDLLVRYLQSRAYPYSVDRVVKSGSFGKGTQIRDHADLDCVVVLNILKSVHDRINHGPQILGDLADMLKRQRWVVRGSVTHNYYTIQFKMYQNGVTMDVDLLPTFEVLGHNPPNYRKKQIYRVMLDLSGHVGSYYSVPLCQLQLDFVRSQPSRVKTLIRLVKYWRKMEVEKHAQPSLRYPNSYAMELITIHVWEKAEASRPRRIKLVEAFKSVLTQLVNYKSLHAEWYKNYSEVLANKACDRLGFTRPIVLDPANPTNNMMDVFHKEAWDHLASIAAKSMRRPLLKDVVIPAYW